MSASRLMADQLAAVLPKRAEDPAAERRAVAAATWVAELVEATPAEERAVAIQAEVLAAA